MTQDGNSYLSSMNYLLSLENMNIKHHLTNIYILSCLTRKKKKKPQTIKIDNGVSRGMFARPVNTINVSVFDSWDVSQHCSKHNIVVHCSTFN